MRQFLFAFLVLLLPIVAIAQEATPSVNTAQAPAAFDAEAFNRLIERAESVLDRGEASNDALEELRKQLSAYRAQATARKDDAAVKVQPLQERLTALGPAPEEGVTEPSDVATLRAEISKELEQLRAPMLAAEDAAQRASLLVRRIDALIRERATDALLEQGPTPLNPALWWAAATEITEYFRSVRSEMQTTWTSETRQAARISNTPIVLFLIGLALLLLFRARRWSRQAQDFLSEGVSLRGAAALGLVGALLQIALPALGLWMLIQALSLLDVFSLRGYFLINAMGLAGFSLYFATWVSRLLFVPTSYMPALIEVGEGERKKLRNAFLLLGLVFAIRQMLRAIAGALDSEPGLVEATNTLLFPAVVLGGVGVFQIGRTLRRLAKEAAAADGSNPFLARVAMLMGTFCVLASILGPVASGIGYAQAGYTIVFSTALSCSIPDDHIDPRRSALFMARSILNEVRDGRSAC